jgi:hypothetical protein
MTTERVRFVGDPVPGETGEPGAQPKIPLSATVAPITQELLTDKKPTPSEEAPKSFRPKPGQASREDDDDLKDDEEGEGSNYERERIGARIGVPVEEAVKVEEYERSLDTELVVPCMFRGPVHLNHEGLMHHWQPGVHLVPLSIAGDSKSNPPKKMHWWLRQNKCKRTGAPQANPRVLRDDDDEEAA